MAFKDPSSTSNPKEQKWVVEISEILNDELKINVETPSVSIFQVPETITTKKPEAYTPQQIGLGPIHHFRPEPYQKMEQKKLAIVRKVLRDYDNVEDAKFLVLNKVREVVPIVRSCYDMFLHGNDHESLATIFAIDGLFLLNLFRAYNSVVDKEKEDYLVFLKNKAKIAKQSLYESAFDTIIKEKMEFEIVNLKNIIEEIAPHPLLRQEEIVVTAENRAEWERILGLPRHRAELPEVGPKKRMLAQDILMVENQIPFMVLNEIEALHLSLGNTSTRSPNNFSVSMIRTFCKVHSPLKLCSKSQAPTSIDHLLYYMYHSIVNNVVPIEKPDDPWSDDESHKKKKKESGPLERDRSLVISVEQVCNLFKKIPQKEIIQAYEQTASILETFCQNKVLIPSASKLGDKVGIKFESLIKRKGIQNIGIQGKDIFLPCITLNIDSEVILRNLVAYEALSSNSDSFPLAEYLGLMCALILNVEDVKLLRSRNVISGDLGDDEVAKLFVGLSSSIPTQKTTEKSNLNEMIDEINKLYESGLTMKAYLFLKNLARWLLAVLRSIGGFAEASWKIVAFVASIVTLFMLTLQAYCDVYGCDKQKVTMLSYTSS